MEKIKNREKELNEYEYFKNKPGLAYAVAELEEKTKIKIPTKFNEVIMPEYEYGEVKIKLGSIGRYYFIEIKKGEQEPLYKLFETKQEFKKFFINDGLDKEVMSFFIKEIDEIPIFL